MLLESLCCTIELPNLFLITEIHSLWQNNKYVIFLCVKFKIFENVSEKMSCINER